MNKKILPVLGIATLAVSVITPVLAADAPDEELEAVLITGQRSERVSRGATGLDLDIKDTPQSISVVSSELMQQFGANSLNDALRLATGINVEEWETNRTNYMARGFDIVNTQIDGIGMPNDWGIVTGAMDAFGYDKLEVIRGANGLLTGVGNSSGTINYVRKRPTNERQGVLNTTVGSWNSKRIEGDYSTPLTASGSWAGRVVAAYEDSDSYLRLLKNDRTYLYGVVDGQLGSHTTLTLGYAFQQTHTDGNMWGGLPLLIDEGGGVFTQASYPRDSSMAQDWTMWDTRTQSAFLELTYALPGDWTLKGTYNFRKFDSASKLFYASVSRVEEAGEDPYLETYGWPGRYGEDNHAHLGDISLSGKFSAFGRDHDLVLGYAQSHGSSRSNTHDVMNDVDAGDPDAYPLMPAFPWPADFVAEPIWGPGYTYAHGGSWLHRAYGAARLSLADRVKAIVGFNQTRFRRAGLDTWGGLYDPPNQSELSPYAGLTVDLTSQVMAYASYSDIYQQQDQTDIDHQFLDPTRGVNVELGVKAEWLDHRLLTSLAWFSAKQDDLATQAPPALDGNGDVYWPYEAVDVRSRGFEFEATGKLGELSSVVLGMTSLDMKSLDADYTYRWVPKRTVKLSFSTALPALPQLRLGVGGRWQSKVANTDDSGSLLVRQDAYAVLNAFGEWQASERLAVRANIDNITNEKYLNSLYWVGYYGAPRNYSLGLDFRF